MTDREVWQDLAAAGGQVHGGRSTAALPPSDNFADEGLDFAATVDIGGTKIAAGSVSRDGRLTSKLSVPTPRDDPQALMDAVVELVRHICEVTCGTAAGVGISVAAAIDSASGDVRYAPNIPAWRDYPLRRLLADEVGLPVVMGFDGHLTALGEYWKGAGRGTRNMAMLTVGTGIGGGLILDGRLYRGSDNLAGAAGWMIANPDALNSPRSRSIGNLESLSAGPAIATAYQQQSVNCDITRAEDVLAAARSGDQRAQAILREAGRFLAMAVAGIVSLLNPDKVILGGGLGSTGVFLGPVRKAVAQFSQPTSRTRVLIETAALGPDAALVGAGYALFEEV